MTSLSQHFDHNDEKMTLEQAIEELSDVNAEQRSTIGSLEDQLEGEVKSPDVVIDGLASDSAPRRALTVIDGSNYYSEALVNMLADGSIAYSEADGAVYYNSADCEDAAAVARVGLDDTDILYDGVNYAIYGPDEGVAISMGGQTFNSGFVIYDDYSLFGEGDGYALFDLRGEYSSISFDAGRTNEYEIQNVTLQVFLDDVLTEEHDLNGQNPWSIWISR